MLGMFGDADSDCTTLVEDYRLDNANDYMRLVSSGMTLESQEMADKKIANNGDDFELFYGVKNDPSYGKYKEGIMSGLLGLGCGGDCQCASCKANRGVSGFGCEGNPTCHCGGASTVGFSGNLGSNYSAWPPGPRPDPYKWTDPKSGTTYTLVMLDSKWMYQSSRDKRLFITTSNLYDLMGVKKDPETLTPTTPVPGEMHPDQIQAQGWSNWQVAGVGAGWLIVAGLVGYAAYKGYKQGAFRG